MQELKITSRTWQDYSSLEAMRCIVAMDKNASVRLRSDGMFFLHTSLRVQGTSTQSTAVTSGADTADDAILKAFGELVSYDEILYNDLVNNIYFYYRWNGSCFTMTKMKSMENG